MASVSNAFDALQGASFVSSKKKKRNRKKPQSTTDSPTDTPSIGPRPVPTSHELEAKASVVSHDGRLELWERWATELLDEAGFRRGAYVDESGKPTQLRSALLASQALETLAESCIDAVVREDEGNLLYRLFKAVFTATEAEVLQQLVFAVVKVSTLSYNKGAEIVFASKRALRDVVSAVKRAETHQTETSWKKKALPKTDRTAAARKLHKHDRKTELHEALERVKYQQSAVDEVDDEAVGTIGGGSVARSVSDLQVAFSLASKPFEDATGSAKKGKRNKNKSMPQTSPMLESLKQEEGAYAAEEARLNEEITNLELKLKSLRSQLSTLHVTRQHIQQRKDAILRSLSTGQSNGTAVIPAEDQNEAIGCLEAVVSELQSAVSQSEDEKREYALSYVEAMEKLYSAVFLYQEDLAKTVKFLKDSIQRRMEQEEKMKKISSAALTKEILKTQQHSKQELEHQLKDAVFDSGDLFLKVTRVDTDLKQRVDFLKRYVNPASVGALENAAQQIKDTHQEIKRVSEEKREIVVQLPELQTEGTRKRVDTKEIIKQEEARAREELAAKQQPPRSRKSTSSQGDPFSPNKLPSEETPPRNSPYTHVIFAPSQPPVQPPVMSAVQDDPVVHQPVVPSYPAPGPVQRPVGGASSSSTKRMAWKKMGDQSIPNDQADLPTPGEARKQGKL